MLIGGLPSFENISRKRTVSNSQLLMAVNATHASGCVPNGENVGAVQRFGSLLALLHLYVPGIDERYRQGQKSLARNMYRVGRPLRFL